MNEIFDTDLTFADLGLRDSVLKGVTEAGFIHPTHIQKELIPLAMAGKDVLGQAKTGTGKTAAFGLPVLHHCNEETPMQALILTPTRELAAQVAAEMDELGKHTPIRTACVIGGESMRRQSRQVQGGAQIMVGTPGRIMDMQGRRQIHFDNLRFVVLDEVDRMLDIGFRDDIRRILKSIKGERQTIFVSATISEDIERLGRQFMKPDAEKIVIASSSLTVSLVEQFYFAVEPWDKMKLLKYVLKREAPDTTVIFCRTKATVHRLTKALREKNINAKEIHGDLMQKKRNRVMESMRSGNIDVLVASDLAARGLDVEHISHVINYDLPEDPEVYVHRIGRTARAGRKGVAWSFVSSDQGQLLTEIEKLTGVLVERVDYDDFEPGPVPAGQRDERKLFERKPLSVEEKLKARVTAQSADELTDDEKKAMFPDGVVPTSASGKKSRLGGKFRTKRRR